jgi:hypothetical protein
VRGRRRKALGHFDPDRDELTLAYPEADALVEFFVVVEGLALAAAALVDDYPHRPEYMDLEAQLVALVDWHRRYPRPEVDR